LHDGKQIEKNKKELKELIKKHELLNRYLEHDKKIIGDIKLHKSEHPNLDYTRQQFKNMSSETIKKLHNAYNKYINDNEIGHARPPAYDEYGYEIKGSRKALPYKQHPNVKHLRNEYDSRVLRGDYDEYMSSDEE